MNAVEGKEQPTSTEVANSATSSSTATTERRTELIEQDTVVVDTDVHGTRSSCADTPWSEVPYAVANAFSPLKMADA